MAIPPYSLCRSGPAIRDLILKLRLIQAQHSRNVMPSRIQVLKPVIPPLTRMLAIRTRYSANLPRGEDRTKSVKSCRSVSPLPD